MLSGKTGHVQFALGSSDTALDLGSPSTGGDDAQRQLRDRPREGPDGDGRSFHLVLEEQKEENVQQKEQSTGSGARLEAAIGLQAIATRLEAMPQVARSYGCSDALVTSSFYS